MLLIPRRSARAGSSNTAASSIPTSRRAHRRCHRSAGDTPCPRPRPRDGRDQEGGAPMEEARSHAGMRPLLTVVFLLVMAPVAAAQPAEQRDMSLVGQDDLQARSAYQPVIQRQGNRWLAYVGHHGGQRLNPLTGQMDLNGTSIVDVTDPSHPRYLHHIPGAAGEAEAGGAAMVRVCEGKTLPKGDPAKAYLLRTLGNLAHEVWDVSAPEQPQIGRAHV